MTDRQKILHEWSLSNHSDLDRSLRFFLSRICAKSERSLARPRSRNGKSIFMFSQRWFFPAFDLILGALSSGPCLRSLPHTHIIHLIWFSLNSFKRYLRWLPIFFFVSGSVIRAKKCDWVPQQKLAFSGWNSTPLKAYLTPTLYSIGFPRRSSSPLNAKLSNTHDSRIGCGLTLKIRIFEHNSLHL